ncbi:cation:H+ antiporter [Limimonas halophila]|uniref:Cation:H+ antiporter n=1 Tax=Limimonas halophila TaxID=1082479 RepID=A0A1G7Q0J4_9PROT|nr:cation transporter [Limimonas halophila]SDF92025.1 cation:H+ antiporter [Limimonas halophila]
MALDLTLAVPLFLVCAAVIAVGGVAMTAVADCLADRTGFGEALVGGILLGISTSFSGTVTSITAAVEGHASLAVSNGIGGIAVQTVFLAVGDILYRRANLEHAAASATALVQLGLLLLLLGLPLMAATMPAVAVAGLHPVSPVLLAVYLAGVRLTRSVQQQPMWFPQRTAELRVDQPEADPFPSLSTAALALRYAGLAAILGLAGWGIAQTGMDIVRATGLSQSFVGAAFTATSTSLPELVITLAAVRRGALQLAVSGIVGGNTFDVLFLVLSDAGYRPGSIYHAVGMPELFLIAWAIVMSAVLMLGLLHREKRGWAAIGWESVTLIAVYLLGLLVQVWAI